MQRLCVLLLSFWICACAAQDSQFVDLEFVKDLFKTQLNLLKNYTAKECLELGHEFDPAATEAKLDECIVNKLLPNVSHHSTDHFSRMRVLVQKLPNMTSPAEFIPWSDEVDRICKIGPTLHDCFGNATLQEMNICWKGYFRRSFTYVYNLMRRICESRRGMLRLFNASNTACLNKYAANVKACIKKSHLEDETPCSVVPCLQNAVGTCGIKKVDDFLGRFFKNFQNYSSCTDENERLVENGTSLVANSTAESPLKLFTTTIPSFSLRSKVETAPFGERAQTQLDPCTIMEAKVGNLFQDETPQLISFFKKLDSICLKWNVTVTCPDKSKFTQLIRSQCHYASGDKTMTFVGCIDETIGKRVSQLWSFCKIAKVGVSLPTVMSWCSRVFGDQDVPDGHPKVGQFLNDPSLNCPNDPLPAARKSEEVTPLLWGVVVLPMAIFSIALSIHCLTRGKGPPNRDHESGQGLMSLESKDGSRTESSSSTV